MKDKKKNKLIMISIFTITLFLILVVIDNFIWHGQLKRIFNRINRQDENEIDEFATTHIFIDNDFGKLKYEINVQEQSNINKIEFSDFKIYANDKNKISIDHTVENEDDLSYKVVTEDGEESENTIEIADTLIFENGHENSNLTGVNLEEYNTIGRAGLIDKIAKCECGKLGNIFSSAKTRQIADIYTDNDEKGYISIDINEKALVYFELLSNDSVDYEVVINETQILNSITPAQISGKDVETAMVWIDENYVDVMKKLVFRARPVIDEETNVEEITQNYSMKVYVINLENYSLIVDDLGLDLTSFACDHFKYDLNIQPIYPLSISDPNDPNFNNHGVAGVDKGYWEYASFDNQIIKDIYDKAKEMNLVTSNGKSISTGGLAVEITEPSFVYFDFYGLNSEQKTGGRIPLPYCLNYEVRIDSYTWLDAGKPTVMKQGADYERLFAWLDQNYVDNRGMVQFRVRAQRYPNVPIQQLGQTLHLNVYVLKYSDFVTAANELGIDVDSLGISMYEQQP